MGLQTTASPSSTVPVGDALVALDGLLAAGWTKEAVAEAIGATWRSVHRWATLSAEAPGGRVATPVSLAHRRTLVTLWGMERRKKTPKA
jgi:hypothetical protein